MSVAASLFEHQFDFPSFDDEPLYEMMVAAVPRSGSTMFCLDLWESGVLGAPLEYLNFHLVKNIPRWRETIGAPAAYWSHVKRSRTSPNGVFSHKMFASVYKQVAEVSTDLLAKLAPSHVIYFTRQDIDAQAISYSRAIQSGAWFADVAHQKSADYSYDHIAECKKFLLRQMDDWEYLFQLTNTNVLRLTYEEVLADKESAVRKVAKYVTGSSNLSKISVPRVLKQRDQISGQWQGRFKDEYECRKQLEDAGASRSASNEQISCNVPSICVKQTGTSRGRGVFAGRSFRKGDLIETAPVVPFEQCSLPKRLSTLVYQWRSAADNSIVQAIAFGYGSLYNHDDPANLRYLVDTARTAIHYFAVRDVAVGEELTINYNTTDGGPEGGNDKWFEFNGVAKE